MSLFGEIREGGDIEDITTENIVSVIPAPDATYIVFSVHGSEGTRTYRFGRHVSEIVSALPELAEFVAETGLEAGLL